MSAKTSRSDAALPAGVPVIPSVTAPAPPGGDAEVKAKNRTGYQALRCAAWDDHVYTVRLLRAARDQEITEGQETDAPASE